MTLRESPAILPYMTDKPTAPRIRIIFDTEEEIRLAVRLAATKAGSTPSDVINAVLRKALSGEIQDARKYLPKKKRESEE